MEQIVFNIDFGMGALGKIVELNNKYLCYTTPLYGGDWILEAEFDTLNKAKEFIINLT